MIYNVLIDNIFTFVHNILSNIFLEPFVLLQIILFSVFFLLSLLLGYIFLFKKLPSKFYEAISQRQNKLIVIVLAFCCIITLLWDFYFFTFTKDDAFITFRYSKNLVNGYGIVFNRDNNPVEGYSNFLWVLLSSIPLILNIEIVTYTKIFSISLSFCTIIAMYKIARFFFDKKLSLFGPILYALYYPFHLWTVGGLETPLFLLLIIGAYYFAYRETLTNKFYPSVSCIFSILLTLTRPEGIIYVIGLEGSLIFYYLLRERKKSKILQRVISFMIVGLSYLIYFIWRFNYYGYFFPNTYYLKKSSFVITRQGIEYLTIFLIFTSPIFLFLLIGIYKLIKERKNLKMIIWLGTPILINFGITLNLEQFNAAQGFRFLLPSMPFIIIFSIKYFQEVRVFMNSQCYENKKFMKLTKKYGFSFLILFLIIIPCSAPLVYKNVTFNDANEKHYLVAQWFNEQVPTNATVAYIDMGIVPYYCELNFIDMWGLMDENIAHEGFSVDYVLSQNPTFILFKIWGPNFSNNPDFQEKYEHFFTIQFYEITQYLEEINYDLIFYKFKDFNISNESLVQIFA